MWIMIMAICLGGTRSEMCDVSTRVFNSENSCKTFSEKEVQSWQKKENIQWLKIQSREIKCIKFN